MFTPDEIRAREREADGEADEGTSAPEDCLHGTPGCACYQSGYAAGKDKAYFEIHLVIDAADHPAGHGCLPCQVIRAVRRHNDQSALTVNGAGANSTEKGA